ncbi:hypothetical protein [Brevibacillus laterosporus]|uniref:hypothetical protein n=1 Tax=Brevibacillus laterosporus TaxID=1465 RepID=UPI0014443BDC|nr:hypothetical protein [Brevibacillus laterosporus]NKQ20652.1 hypothetical protein [Brevibacillus laterosporus]WNX29740.1 hypothetical protein RWW94_16070 [Brevibacillus laterosporus]
MDIKNFEAYLKKIGSGKGDSIEVVLEIENPKDQEILNLMRLRKTYVFVAIGDNQLSFELDTQTDEETPKIPYTVDGSGVVEVKSDEASDTVQDTETEALEDQPQDEATPEIDGDQEASQQDDTPQVEPKTINEFILSGQAPTFEDLPYNFVDIVTRREAGERSMDIAASLDLTPSKWSKIWKDYKGRIASAARDWDDLRNLSQVTPEYSDSDLEAEQSDGGAA